MLSAQREFRCRHSGACCTFGWHIPVEPDTCSAIAAAVGTGRLRLPDRGPGAAPTGAWLDAGQPPEGAAGVLLTRSGGACVFFDADAGRLCAIQRDIGHGALPSACQQFPRISLLDDRGVHVALSHYCPTVASMLVANPSEAVDVVRLQADDPVRRRAEGFDARAAVPPFLRPGVAFDLEAFDAWERGVARALGRPGADADTTLRALAAAAEDLRGWRPSRGSLADDVARVVAALDRGGRSAHGGRTGSRDYAAMAALFDDAVSSVPAGLPLPSRSPGWDALDAALVAPAWPGLSMSTGRFLAAKVFGSPVAWQGDGVRSQIVWLATARAVLRVETARAAGADGRSCDGGTIVTAARAADALLEHLSDRPSLIRRWAGIESLQAGAFAARLGLGSGAAS